MSGTKFHYAVLGVAEDASPDDLKRAYRRRAMENHPDRTEDKSPEGIKAAEARMADVNVAYDILSDPLKRSLYDKGTTLEEREAALDEAIDLAFQVTQGRQNLVADLEQLIQKYGLKDEELAAGIERKLEEARQREERQRAQAERNRQDFNQPGISRQFADLLNALKSGEKLKSTATEMAALIRSDTSQATVVLRSLDAEIFTRVATRALTDQVFAVCPDIFTREVLPTLIDTVNSRRRVKPSSEVLAKIIQHDPSQCHDILNQIKLGVVITSPASALHDSLWTHHRAEYAAKVLPVLLIAMDRQRDLGKSSEILEQIVTADTAKTIIAIASLTPDIIDAEEAQSLRQILFKNEPVAYADKMQPYLIAALKQRGAVGRVCAWLDRFAKLNTARAGIILDSIPATAMMHKDAANLRATFARLLPEKFTDELFSGLISEINAEQNIDTAFPALTSILNKQPARMEMAFKNLSATALVSPAANAIATKMFNVFGVAFSRKVCAEFVSEANNNRNIEHDVQWLAKIIEQDNALSMPVLTQLSPSSLLLKPLAEMLHIRHAPEYGAKMYAPLAIALNEGVLPERCSELLCRIVELTPEISRNILQKVSVKGLRRPEARDLNQKLAEICPDEYKAKAEFRFRDAIFKEDFSVNSNHLPIRITAAFVLAAAVVTLPHAAVDAVQRFVENPESRTFVYSVLETVTLLGGGLYHCRYVGSALQNIGRQVETSYQPKLKERLAITAYSVASAALTNSGLLSIVDASQNTDRHTSKYTLFAAAALAVGMTYRKVKTIVNQNKWYPLRRQVSKSRSNSQKNTPT